MGDLAMARQGKAAEPGKGEEVESLRLGHVAELPLIQLPTPGPCRKELQVAEKAWAGAVKRTYFPGKGPALRPAALR